ncbi:MAG: hypothetical protein UX02_C0002G0214 [Candidatus Moranbacteria bacterium GW2011_GWC1_45_18]|nr:MAG: hypothetical protein UT79_C0001G0247 [Candidatus Moranbacteria bacterium GW2011_GWC2_40_12]KKT33406.1 MAG: hypothetical protein UW19_C0009G0052 [Candidatus Moranbacteria bacterium GW2011_GWF2_44_10]KKT99895.1 MAG: hypothetical protein UX02_C0002G0214 [Candidatus Moranbacteria bacterium GW2011_GWC1_45_18]OGI24573.1 MAG: hypothetical protein A2194_03465 [Candidatus Moranbacteria bacterium RIFOXYA1_FULL_44_8]OGI42318.1 MAG: hypothetical protein A2593_04415 [Candidatus Moranbacteria bacteri
MAGPAERPPARAGGSPGSGDGALGADIGVAFEKVALAAGTQKNVGHGESPSLLVGNNTFPIAHCDFVCLA